MAQNLIAVQEHRNAEERLQRHAKLMGPQDGTNQAALRQWLDEVSSAKEWTGATDGLTLSMVGYLVKGDLDEAVRNWIRANDQAEPQVPNTWVLIRRRIEATFLDQDEQEYLRRKVDVLGQAPFQDVREYSRAYDRTVKRAYSAEERAVPVVRERLVRAFVSGLRDRSVRARIHAARPTTLEAAYTEAATVDRAEQLAGPLDRHEEPMEVAALPPPPAEMLKGAKEEAIEDVVSRLLDRKLSGFQRQLCQLGKQLEGAVAHKPPQRPSAVRSAGSRPQGAGQRRKLGRPAWTPDGRPICFECGQPGHLAVECRRANGPGNGN